MLFVTTYKLLSLCGLTRISLATLSELFGVLCDSYFLLSYLDAFQFTRFALTLTPIM